MNYTMDITMMIPVALLLFLAFLGLINADMITPDSTEVSHVEGSGLTLSCSYSSSNPQS
ncbi:hypothetical protein AALO_G00004980 [Alosa alosa]|uniref:NADH dehydrogenase subunit 3 n=1 Tax=Alosa alosa TaxID=278164 RepID=A0AAV6HJD2_9TELE|nr:hypothetical protein AALO_G00004980 [Alosa alosa]